MKTATRSTMTSTWNAFVLIPGETEARFAAIQANGIDDALRRLRERPDMLGAIVLGLIHQDIPVNDARRDD
ncbi:hypothetical protein KHC28_11660 [Ancylobacter sonchi]|uniref:hypothetical protein n=1 Tax=Ancylobacter sonchi TaxID=1937790 RepID=UPI001BD29A38|nr:hypothetical protein [Ancylobacter sonchi]MBS7534313.1 hypothetical protein [Ancylobacter sonchi]